VGSVLGCLLLLSTCSADPMVLSVARGDVREQKLDSIAWLGARLDLPALDILPNWRLHYEFEAGMIDAQPDDQNALNLMLGPTLQWHWPATEWTVIVEGGLRPTYINRAIFNERSIGGSFHLASHIGAVFRLRRIPVQLGARFLHISNGSVRGDSPGMNYALFSFGYYWYPQAEMRSGAGAD
jgi:hypothetical protein